MNELNGDDPNKSIRLTMKYLISDPILDGYTWRGTVTPPKRAFKELVNLNRLIFKSVRASLEPSKFKKYKFLQYKNYMIQWLKHSRSRQRIVTYQYPIAHQQNDNYDDVDDDDGGAYANIDAEEQ